MNAGQWHRRQPVSKTRESRSALRAPIGRDACGTATAARANVGKLSARKKRMPEAMHTVPSGSTDCRKDFSYMFPYHVEQRGHGIH